MLLLQSEVDTAEYSRQVGMVEQDEETCTTDSGFERLQQSGSWPAGVFEVSYLITS
jgi:hypothetical protein